MPGHHTYGTSSSYSSVPSPTWSQSTLPSSAGVYTPPPAVYGPRLVPLPAVPCQIHPYLGFSPSPTLKYDVSLPIPAISANHRPISPSVLAESAANPPLPMITLVSPHLPWGLVIRPSSAKHSAYITVADVLDGLYHALRLCVERSEFNSLSPQAQTQANNAYVSRYRRIVDPAMRSMEKEKGLKRVDFLMDKRMWMGLSSTSRGPDCWMVTFQ